MNDLNTQVVALAKTGATEKEIREKIQLPQFADFRQYPKYDATFGDNAAAILKQIRASTPWLLDGPINGEAFKTYVEKVLAPTLKPGDLVIMDNLGSHKGGAIRRAIRAARAKLFFLPKYSPDLNPISKVFAKLKHLLRKAAALNNRNPHRRGGRTARRLHRRRMRKLLHQCRIPSLISSRSSVAVISLVTCDVILEERATCTNLPVVLFN